MLYDLHIHSCLSPCGDNEMTPANIAGMAKVAGLSLVAVADHNTALNVRAAAAACDKYGIKLVPAIEMNTEEEIHLLCYFKTVEAAERMGELIFAKLPDFKFETQIYGDQIVMDELDNERGRIDRLLTNACAMNIYEAVRVVHALGGLAVPAHIERDSYSILSALGLMPQDIDFDAFEVFDLAKLPKLKAQGAVKANDEILHSSDAHYLWIIGEGAQELPAQSVLHKIL